MNDAQDFSNELGQEFPDLETSEIFPPNDSEAQLSLWEGRPVSQSVVPGSEEARKMSVGSGEKLLPLLKRLDPLGSCLKTLLLSEQWASTEYLLNWKVLVTPQGRSVFQLVPSTPRNSGIDIGSWGTPSAQDHKDCNESGARAEVESGLPRQVHHATWPTPRTTDTHGPGRHGYGGQDLRTVVYETQCDCQNPEPEGGAVALVSNHCPIHNLYPDPLPEGVEPIGTPTSGPLARTESFVVRLEILSAWLMAFPWSYLKNWERKGDKRRKSAKYTGVY